MSAVETARGRAVVVQPGDGPSYWQPVPARGHADPALVPAATGFPGRCRWASRPWRWAAASASTRTVTRWSCRSASAGRGTCGNTVLSGIVALLERAQAERPRLAKAAGRAAAWFLGRILIGAAIVFAVWWFIDPARAFPATPAVLVVTCPCALSLATPTALAAATAALARRGILVAHTDAIETLSKATHVLWDKTGTLTRGLVRIEDVHGFGAVDPSRAMAWAAALEQMSEHPIARAFAASAGRPAMANEVTVQAGQGLEGRLDGRQLRIGTRAYAEGLRTAAPTRGGEPSP